MSLNASSIWSSGSSGSRFAKVSHSLSIESSSHSIASSTPECLIALSSPRMDSTQQEISSSMAILLPLRDREVRFIVRPATAWLELRAFMEILAVRYKQTIEFRIGRNHLLDYLPHNLLAVDGRLPT